MPSSSNLSCAGFASSLHPNPTQRVRVGSIGQEPKPAGASDRVVRMRSRSTAVKN